MPGTMAAGNVVAAKSVLSIGRIEPAHPLARPFHCSIPYAIGIYAADVLGVVHWVLPAGKQLARQYRACLFTTLHNVAVEENYNGS